MEDEMMREWRFALGAVCLFWFGLNVDAVAV